MGAVTSCEGPGAEGLPAGAGAHAGWDLNAEVFPLLRLGTRGDLGPDRLADVLRKLLAQHAERARRCHHDQRLGFAALHRFVEAGGERREKALLLLVVPIGLLHRAASGADGTEGAARLVGADRTGRRGLVLVDLLGAQIGICAVADVLQHQRAGAVAHHHPLAAIDL